MKKFITILISCSLALAASAMAQQQDNEEQGKPKKEKGQTEKSQPANEVKPAPKLKSVPKEHMETKLPGQDKGALKAESTESTGKPHDMTRMHGQNKGELKTESTESTGQPHDMTRMHGQNKGELKAESTESAPKMHEMTKGAGKEPVNADAAVTGHEQGMKNKKEHGVHTESAIVNKPTGLTPGGGANAAALDANKMNAQGAKLNAKGMKKPELQTIQKIKTEHANFRAQPRPDKVPAVTFNANFRINNSDQWQGRQYEVFRSYHPERHDQGWYRSRNLRVELIGGGYYYFDGGYCYPAWGYDSSAEYYAYDGPIYVGSHSEPPDRVIADVQAALQEMGYYQGEVDGLLGPLTRQALTAYQADNGLYTTATIDEPTLDSLGMG